MRKKVLMVLLAVSLTAACGVSVYAAEEQQETTEESTGYQEGDTVEDFNITLMDGSETSLYKILEGKQAVVLNFWATWCNPCKEEFPYLEELYTELSDQIGFMAVDAEENTEEELSTFRENLGIKELPMGIDKNQELQQKFGVQAYPTTVVIDKDKKICCVSEGAFRSPAQIKNLLAKYTDIPRDKPDSEWPSVEELTAALGITDDRIQVEIPEEDEDDENTVWPFVISEDGTGIEASNSGKADTTASLIFKLDAKAGESLNYKYKTNAEYIKEGFVQEEDGGTESYFCPEDDWTEKTVIFDEDGTHEIKISFADVNTTTPEIYGMLSEMKLLSAEETDQKKAEQDKIKKENAVQTLQGNETAMEPVGFEFKNAMLYDEETPDEPYIFLVKQGDGEEKFRVKIGTDVDPESLVIFYQGQYYNLSKLEKDEEGYLFDVSAADADEEQEASSLKGITLFDLENSESKEQYLYFISEDAMEKQIQDIEEEDGTKTAWKYVSDEEAEKIKNSQKEESGDAEETGDEESGESEGLELSYTAKVTDEDGNPIEGVLLQICNDVTCNVQTTGKDGTLEMKMAPYAYEVHVLKAPEGYAATDEVFVMPEAGGELDITLSKE